MSRSLNARRQPIKCARPEMQGGRQARPLGPDVEAMTAKQPPREPVKCARPGCWNTFTPGNARKYCSRTCQSRCHRYRFALRQPA